MSWDDVKEYSRERNRELKRIRYREDAEYRQKCKEKANKRNSAARTKKRRRIKKKPLTEAQKKQRNREYQQRYLSLHRDEHNLRRRERRKEKINEQ